MASTLYQHLPSVVGIVGAGKVGRGIAEVCASKGLSVCITDTAARRLDRSLSLIEASLAARARLPPLLLQETLARISCLPSLEAFTDAKAEFVIEAAHEAREVKEAIFRSLDRLTPVHTILASTTDTCSITSLGAVTSKPHKVVGMHFMHPVVSDSPGVELGVELSKGMHTSQQTLSAARSLAEKLGKQTCVSEDRPGFTLYRLQMLLINEAFTCLMEGNSTAHDIDKGMMFGYAGGRHGPLRTADEIGLDTCLNILRSLHLSLGERFRPCPLLVQHVEAGWLGAKSGRGVFVHDGAHTPPLKRGM